MSRKISFLFGIILLASALLSITLVPVIFKKFASFDFLEYYFTVTEFFLLFFSGCFFAYSSKYYTYQILAIACAFLYYMLFVKFFSL